MTDVVLDARGLTKSYRGGTAVVAGCDFIARRGEVVAIVGASGVGKTTLLQMLAGILPADAGSVHCAGRQMTGPSQDVAVVFQDYGLLPWRTATRNVAFPLEVAGVARGDRRSRSARALADLGLGDAAHQYPHQLSGGMQQRLAIARALVGRPSVLLLDEPFSALDVGSKRALIARLDRLRTEKDLTIVIVTHDLGDAVEMADRVVLLEGKPARPVAEQRIDRDGSLDELKQTLEEMILGTGATERGHASRPAQEPNEGGDVHD